MPRHATIDNCVGYFVTNAMHGEQLSGHCGNVRYKGRNFYSYAQPIAHISLRMGYPILFITSRSYSQTSSRHQQKVHLVFCIEWMHFHLKHHVNMYLPQEPQVFNVPDVTDPACHDNIKDILADFNQCIHNVCNTRLRQKTRLATLRGAENYLHTITFLIENYDPLWEAGPHGPLSSDLGAAYALMGHRDVRDAAPRYTPDTLDAVIRLRAIHALERGN